MKRFALFLVVVMMITTGMAQSSQQRVVKMPERMAKLTKSVKNRPPQRVLQSQSKTTEMKRFEGKLFNAGKKKSQKAATQKHVRKAYGDPIIEEQPEGELVYYTRQGHNYESSMFGTYENFVEDGAVLAVFASDNTIYLKNIISGFYCPGWVKGTINGSKITIQFPQTILEQFGDTYYADLLVYDAAQEFYVPMDEKTLTLEYNAATKAISTSAGTAIATGYNIIGLTDETGEWYGFGDYDFSMTTCTIESLSVPEGLQTTQYVLQADDYQGHLVNVGFQGNDVYVQGLYADMPEEWVKGSIKGDKVIFKSGQYIGPDNYYEYMVSATEEVLYDDMYEEYYTSYALSDADITFDYDATTKTLSNSSLFLINAGTSRLYYTVAFNHATIIPFVEQPATPAPPTDITYIEEDFSDYYSGYGWGYLSYTINPTDADGNYILSDKLSYAFYTRIQGEERLMEISPDFYMYITEPMSEIPYDFTDKWDIYNNSIYLYVTGVDAYGMQTIYRGGGEERRSEIVWTETGQKPQPEKETPTYPELDPDNTGSSIVLGDEDSQSVFEIGDELAETYDVAMKLQGSDFTGLHIDKISFPLISTNNISNIKVWLSTNLRVENGTNAPNLIEIPVTATESGFISATLPTPYTISEDGVYVGYSLTVDEVDDYNAFPILARKQAQEGGLYIHTSKVIYQWRDISEESGCTAFINVEMSGASVKNNAVTLQELDNIYAKAGQPIYVETTVSNYGAQGISSLDIDFTLNGVTESKHFDLDSPISNVLGKTCTVNTELSAVAECGDYPLTAKVTKVNGVANEQDGAEQTSLVSVVNILAKHRALLEEYTGTWCGWCVRGYVALEKLAELYPDDYVLVSYHNADPMEILLNDPYSYINEYPSEVDGFPSAMIDRVIPVDPYYGYDEDYGIAPLTITKPLNQRNKVFGQADIQLEASLSEDLKEVNVNTKVTFAKDAKEVNYGLEYVLVADGLTGETLDWAQSNYYDDMVTFDSNLTPFEGAGSYVSGLAFNDVAVQVSAKNGISIPGSIPTEIVADQVIPNSFTFNLEGAVNTSKKPVIQDVTKLKVVAILVNNETGEVINANKCLVDSSTGISITDNSSNKIAPAAYYDLEGRRLSTPKRGINIVVMSDGTAKKVMMK